MVMKYRAIFKLLDFLSRTSANWTETISCAGRFCQTILLLLNRNLSMQVNEHITNAHAVKKCPVPERHQRENYYTLNRTVFKCDLNFANEIEWSCEYPRSPFQEVGAENEKPRLPTYTVLRAGTRSWPVMTDRSRRHPSIAPTGIQCLAR